MEERKGYDFISEAVYPIFVDYFLEYPRNRYDWNTSVYKYRERYYTDYENDIPSGAKYLCDIEPSDWEFEDTNIDENLREEFGNKIWEEWEEYEWSNRDKNPSFHTFIKEKHPEKEEEFLDEAQSWASDVAQLFEEETDEDDEDNELDRLVFRW